MKYFIYLCTMLMILASGCQTKDTVVGDDNDNTVKEDYVVTITNEDRISYIKTPYPSESQNDKLSFSIEINVRKQNGQTIDSPVEVSLRIAPASYGVSFSDGRSQYTAKTNHIGKLIVPYNVEPYVAQKFIGKSVTITITVKPSTKISFTHSLMEKQD